MRFAGHECSTRQSKRLPGSTPCLRPDQTKYVLPSSFGGQVGEAVLAFGAMSAANVLRLQRSVGNAAVGRLLKRAPLVPGYRPSAAAFRERNETVRPFNRGDSAAAATMNEPRTNASAPPLESPAGALQRQADGPQPAGSRFVCPQPPKDSRCIADEVRLTAAFWSEQGGTALIADGGRLHDALHNSPPLREAGNEPDEVVKLFKKALNRAPVPTGVTPIRVDERVGGWDPDTHKRVFQFQQNNGIQPGGFEAGRKTLLALDGHLRTGPSKPTLNAECGQGDNVGVVLVHGDGFPPGFVELSLVNALSQFAKVDAKQHFDASVGLGARTGTQFITVKDSAGQSQTVEIDCRGAGPPAPSGTNPELEATLDRLDFAIHNLILRQRDGVQALQADLRSLDPKQPGPGRQAFMFGLNMILSFSYGLAEFGLRNTFKKNYDENLRESDPLSRDVFDNGFDKTYDQAFQAGSQKLVDFVANLVFDDPKDESTRRQAKANDFAQAQLDMVTGAGFKMADDFEATTKPALRRATGPVSVKGSEKDLVPNTFRDSRQTRALLLLKSMERLVQGAFQEHYDAALGAWASTLAGDRLKTTGDPSKLTERLEPDPNDPSQMRLVAARGRIVTDLGGAADQRNVPGVLEVVLGALNESAIHFVHPDSPLRIESARISGLSAEVRRKLIQQHKIIGAIIGHPAMPLPVVARDNGNFAVDDKSDEAQVQVGINEAGTTFNLTRNAEGRRWLRVKGGVDGIADEQSGFQSLIDTVKILPIPRVEEGGS